VFLIGGAPMMGMMEVSHSGGCDVCDERVAGEPRSAWTNLQLVADAIGDGRIDAAERIGGNEGARGYRFEREGVSWWALWSEDGLLHLPGDAAEVPVALDLDLPNGTTAVGVAERTGRTKGILEARQQPTSANPSSASPVGPSIFDARSARSAHGEATRPIRSRAPAPSGRRLSAHVCGGTRSRRSDPAMRSVAGSPTTIARNRIWPPHPGQRQPSFANTLRNSSAHASLPSPPAAGFLVNFRARRFVIAAAVSRLRFSTTSARR
jgi:hypothetical protein